MDPVTLTLMGSAGIVAMLNGKKKQGASPQKGVDAQGRPVTQVIAPNPQTSKRPSSAQSPRADQGNGANQPWYTGPLVAGAGLALAGAARSLGNLVSNWNSGEGTTNDDGNEDYFDDEMTNEAYWADDSAGEFNLGSEYESDSYGLSDDSSSEYGLGMDLSLE
jgi:hypothetical protein